MRFQPADIIFSSADTLIVRFMKRFSKDPVRWGHVLLVENEEWAIEAKNSVRRVPISEVLTERGPTKVIRKADLPDERAAKIVKFAGSLVGQEYGYGRIILHMLDNFFGTHFFTKLDKNKKNQVCSSLVAWAYFCALKCRFNDVHWASCDPDDIEDEQEAHPSDWVLIKSAGGPS